jgi:hypothetical protein
MALTRRLSRYFAKPSFGLRIAGQASMVTGTPRAP